MRALGKTKNGLLYSFSTNYPDLLARPTDLLDPPERLSDQPIHLLNCLSPGSWGPNCPGVEKRRILT
jgi:hypothetical protein